MITGVTGNPLKRLGNGKTAYSVFLALRAKLKYNLPIYANLHLFDTDYIFLESIDDLFVIDGGIIFIDDIQRALMLKKKSTIKIVSRLWSGGSRKDDNYIIYSSSRLIDNVDKDLRVLTDLYCQPLYNQSKHYLIVNFLDNMEQPANTSLPKYLSPEQMKYIFTKYNTKEKVTIW